jgi:regulator of nucleoside diphosphate kinase
MLAATQNGQHAEVRRILAHELEFAQIVEPEKVPPSVVTMNTRVIVREEGTGKTRTFTLVYPGDENIAIGNLSILTPAGAALIGLAEGETLAWITRDGQTKEMTVVEILYQPEANGRWDL